MYLTINHSKTKRQIDGAFQICGSRADITHLCNQLRDRLAEQSWSYGWVTIHDHQKFLEGEQKPIAWDTD